LTERIAAKAAQKAPQPAQIGQDDEETA